MSSAIYYFSEVDSTNNEAKKLIEEQKIKQGLVISKFQTKGRGRFGNKWISQKGNFFSSFFFPVNNYSQVSQIHFKFQNKIYVILGIGINLIKNPSLKTYKTTNIYREIGKKIDFFDFSEIIYKEMKVIFKCF